MLCLICLPGVVMVEWLFLAVPWGCLRFVIVVFPDHIHLQFFNMLFKRTEIIVIHTRIRANKFLALLSDLHVPLNILTNYPNIWV